MTTIGVIAILGGVLAIWSGVVGYSVTCIIRSALSGTSHAGCVEAGGLSLGSLIAAGGLYKLAKGGSKITAVPSGKASGDSGSADGTEAPPGETGGGQGAVEGGGAAAAEGGGDAAAEGGGSILGDLGGIFGDLAAGAA